MPDYIDIMDPPSDEDFSAVTVAEAEGEDIVIDPPVRLLTQFDNRWAKKRIGGPKTGTMLDWQANGCNATTAAMILRWFAEDCPDGRIGFPTKDGGVIEPDRYPMRMAEAFWPEADPPGKVELTAEGRINYRKIYAIAAHYLKTGEIVRREGGNAVDQPSPVAHYVGNRPAGGWMSLLREMLEAGPVIVGIGAPSAHFVLCQGVAGNALLLLDPGAVLFNAFHGGKSGIEDWSGKDGYADGTNDPEAVRMPDPSQWPGGDVQPSERDARCYHRISGTFLDDLFGAMRSLTSLSYPQGALLTP